MSQQPQVSSPHTGEFRQPLVVTKCPKTGDKKLAKRGRPRKYRTHAARQAAYRKRQKRSVHYRSGTDQWSTPQAVFDALAREFPFDLDVCADADNAKCPRYFTPADDGLHQVWRGVCFMNPPYGRQIDRWIQKAYESSL